VKKQQNRKPLSSPESVKAVPWVGEGFEEKMCCDSGVKRSRPIEVMDDAWER